MPSLSEWADPDCKTCDGYGDVPWAPGLTRFFADPEMAVCPDCVEKKLT